MGCKMLFGSASDTIIELCTIIMRNATLEIARMAACFLLDQAKAFEYLDHNLIRQVIRAWRLPIWLVALHCRSHWETGALRRSHSGYPGLGPSHHNLRPRLPLSREEVLKCGPRSEAGMRGHPTLSEEAWSSKCSLRRAMGHSQAG